MSKPHEAAAVLHAEPSSQVRSRMLVVTTCSAGKRYRRSLCAEMLPVGPQEAVQAKWLNMLDAETELTRAEALYNGRAFGLACDTASRLKADFGIISAGLGYVRGTTDIPSYDLTIRPNGPGSILSRIEGKFDSAKWWRSVRTGRFATDFPEDLAGRETVLICLSRRYAQLVADDLLAFFRKSPGALRLFGLSLAESLPVELRQCLMPYDQRLELLGRPGTRVDFSHRALADFVEHVLTDAESQTLEAQRSAVIHRLADVKSVQHVRNQRKTIKKKR